MQSQTEQTELVLSSSDAEELVIGCALYNNDSIPAMRSILNQNGDEFSTLKLGWIWKAILAVYDRGGFVDTHTIIHELKQRSQYDPRDDNNLFWIGQHTLTAHGAETYADIVQRMSIKRDALKVASDIAKSVSDPQATSLDIVTAARTHIDGLTRRLSVSSSIVDGDVLAGQAMDEFEAWIANPAAVRGLSCGIRSIDELVGGFQAGTVTGILAQTSMGKSTLAAGWVRNFAKAGPGLYVPTETPGRIAIHKMALDMAGVPFKAARAGALNRQQQEAASSAYAELMASVHNIKLFDDSAPTMEAIHAKIMQMQAGAGCHWLVIDSGSKFAKSLSIATAGDNLYKATTMASGFMQDMARMGLVVVATWQIGRNTKERSAKGGTGKEPTLHDAKESGSIEEDVDVLFGLYRHDYFVKRNMAEPDDNRYPPGTAKILLLKDRAGCDGDEDILLDFEGGRGFTESSRKRVNANAYLEDKVNARKPSQMPAPYFGEPPDEDDDE